MAFVNEADYEAHIRGLITSHITDRDPDIFALQYKTVGDIVLCREGNSPAIFFIEIKYFQLEKGRLGFGNGTGAGIQPEMLIKKPAYLESHLRWLLGSDAHEGAGHWFVTSEKIRKYVAGGSIGKKQNNIQEALFREVPSLSEDQVVVEIYNWMLNT